MSEPVTTNAFRRKLAAAFAASTGSGAAPLAPITHIAFGDGGYNPDTMTALPPDPDAEALNHELLRKPLAVITQEDEFSVTGTGVVAENELVGYAISEAALIDSDGLIVGFKNFAPKFKESNEEYETHIKLRF